MECRNVTNQRANDKRTRRRKKSFTEALKEKYCMDNEPTFDFIIVSPKKRNNTAAELGHLQTVVLNEMNVTTADIPCHGLTSLCPNVVDLDLANNLLDKWTELLNILCHLPKVKYVNVSRNSLRLNPDDPLPEAVLSVENLALNDTGVSIEEMVRLSAIMPKLKELHLCGNNYESLADIDERIRQGVLTSLECLRLNNNCITSWSEIWKLRHLPYLKFLVLSGNPVQDVFYETKPLAEKDCSCGVGLNLPTSDSVKQSFGPAKQVESSMGHLSGLCNAPAEGSKVSNGCDSFTDGSSVCDDHQLDSATSGDYSEDADVFHQLCCERTIQRKLIKATDSDESDNVSDRERTDSDGDDVMLHMPCSKSSSGHTDIDKCNSNVISFTCRSGFNPINFYSEHFSSGHDRFPSNHREDIALNSQVPVQPKLISGTGQEPAKSDTEALKAMCNTLLCHSMYGTKMSKNAELGSKMDFFTPRAVLFDDESLMPPPKFDDVKWPAELNSQHCSSQDQMDHLKDSRHLDSTMPVQDSVAFLQPYIKPESDLCSHIEVEQEKSPLITQVCMQHTLTQCSNSCMLSDQKIDLEDIQPPTNKVAGQDVPAEAVNTNRQLDKSLTSQDHAQQNPGNCLSLSAAVDQQTNCSLDPLPNAVANDNILSPSRCAKCQCLPRPFEQLQVLYLSNAGVSHFSHLLPFMHFPKLTNVRLKNNPLYSNVNAEDKRKLYIASLPSVNILNGSEISTMEREKAERHYLRYYMDREEKPEFYHMLVKKHGPPVKLVDIDLSAGYQEWATLTFLCDGEVKFTRRIHLVEPVSRLRRLIAMQMGLPLSCFMLYHHACGPSHPESEREMTELRCESLPMSRFDFAEGDEIHIDVHNSAVSHVDRRIKQSFNTSQQHVVK